MEKKPKLNQLKIKSFITNLDSSNKKTIGGRDGFLADNQVIKRTDAGEFSCANDKTIECKKGSQCCAAL